MPDELVEQYAFLEALLAEIRAKHARLPHWPLPDDYVYPPEAEESRRILRGVIEEATALINRATPKPI